MAGGVTGRISLVNSLVGTSPSDTVGKATDGTQQPAVVVLPNSDYIVRSTFWTNAGEYRSGAVTLGRGTTGVSGEVSDANSLVGRKEGDEVGESITLLTNGNFVVSSTGAYNDAKTLRGVGAVTFVNATTGTSGVVSLANSLMGSREFDQIGNSITPLSNGNYVIGSPNWDNGSSDAAGAATLVDGSTGFINLTAQVGGTVSTTNSLVGTRTNDRVGEHITTLANGNYVVSSPAWSNGAATYAGAVTFGNATTGIAGPVTATNSLVGSRNNDSVGAYTVQSLQNFLVTPLTNGNYVVGSPVWDNGGVSDAGAATLVHGFTGFIQGTASAGGTVSTTNSLVGTKADDRVGLATVALTNGNYVVSSPFWSNGAATEAGAATFGNGTTGLIDVVTDMNSLVGSTADDHISGLLQFFNGPYLTGGEVLPLENGNYVVGSLYWDNGTAVDAGAATFGNGTTGVAGAVGVGNSLVGSSTADNVGYTVYIQPDGNGNYIVTSPTWDNSGLIDATAVTGGSGTQGVKGVISSANSLVGLSANANPMLRSTVIDPTTHNFFGLFPDENGIVAASGGRVRVGLVEAVVDDGTLKAELVTGDLIVTDVSPTGRNNNLTVEVRNAASPTIVIRDTNAEFIAAPSGWTLSADHKEISTAAGAFTGKIIVKGKGGNDRVTLPLHAGLRFPAPGIAFEGNDAAADAGDELVISGDAQGDAAFSFTRPETGSVALSDFGIVTWTAVTSLQDTAPVANVTFALPASGGNIGYILDDDVPIVKNGLSRFRADGKITPVVFMNPTGLVTMTRGQETDDVTVETVPDFTAGLAIGTASTRFDQVTFAGEILPAANQSVQVYAGAEISLPNTTSAIVASGTGSILLDTTKNIFAGPSAKIRTDMGSIELTARQAGSSTAAIRLSSAVIDSNNGRVDIEGINNGVEIFGASKVFAGDSIHIIGSGGTRGIRVDSPAELTADGDITLEGTGTASPGIVLLGQSAVAVKILSSRGTVSLLGTQQFTTTIGGVAITSGTGVIVIKADIAASEVIVRGHVATTVPNPDVAAISVEWEGGTTTATDRSIVIQGSTAGEFSFITGVRLGGTTVFTSALGGGNETVISGESIIVTGPVRTLGASLRFDGGLAGLNVPVAGTDVDVVVPPPLSGTNTLTLEPGSTLNLNLGGITADTEYERLNVKGIVDLRGARLSLRSANVPPFVPTAGDTFSLVDGSLGVIGTFDGLPNDSLVPFSGRFLRIRYESTKVIATVIPSVAIAGGEVRLTRKDGQIALVNAAGETLHVPALPLDFVIVGSAQDDSLIIEVDQLGALPAGSEGELPGRKT